MAVQAKEALAADAVTAVADTGYSNGEHGARCEQDGITAIVPRQETVNPKGRQYFTRDEFTYDAGTDSWRCPAGETLTCRRISYQQQNKEYWSKACGGCALKAHCTKAAKRTIVRHFYEDAREAMHRRATARGLRMVPLQRLFRSHTRGRRSEESAVRWCAQLRGPSISHRAT